MCNTKLNGAFVGVQMREGWVAESVETVSDSGGGRNSAGRGHSRFHVVEQLEEGLSQDQITHFCVG